MLNRLRGDRINIKAFVWRGLKNYTHIWKNSKKTLKIKFMYSIKIRRDYYEIRNRSKQP